MCILYHILVNLSTVKLIYVYHIWVLKYQFFINQGATLRGVHIFSEFHPPPAPLACSAWMNNPGLACYAITRMNTHFFACYGSIVGFASFSIASLSWCFMIVVYANNICLLCIVFMVFHLW